MQKEYNTMDNQEDRKGDDNDNDDEHDEPRGNNTQRSEERVGEKDIAALSKRNKDKQ